jgi:hypothetical protein
LTRACPLASTYRVFASSRIVDTVFVEVLDVTLLVTPSCHAGASTSRATHVAVGVGGVVEMEPADDVEWFCPACVPGVARRVAKKNGAESEKRGWSRKRRVESGTVVDGWSRTTTTEGALGEEARCSQARTSKGVKPVSVSITLFLLLALNRTPGGLMEGKG